MSSYFDSYIIMFKYVVWMFETSHSGICHLLKVEGGDSLLGGNPVYVVGGLGLWDSICCNFFVFLSF